MKLKGNLDDIEDVVFDDNLSAPKEIALLRREITTLRRIVIPLKRIDWISAKTYKSSLKKT